jgi:type IV fimbrial biogenesis protein FimT
MRRSEAGFTLVELVVALAIVALVLAVALPRFLPGKRGADLGAAASELRALMRDARSEALLANRDVRLAVDAAGRGYELGPLRAAFRTSGYATGELVARGSVIFQATGGASGSLEVLGAAGAKRTIAPDPLTGRLADGR